MPDLILAALRFTYRFAIRPACAHERDASVCSVCLEAL
jgi:hypothetical protein